MSGEGTERRADGFELRDMHEDEHEQWVALGRRGFLEARRATPAAVESRRRAMAGHRRRVAVDAGRVVATFRSYGVDLPVPGGSALAQAVSSVVVAATHRRRGLLSCLMATDLQEARERGDALAVLIAAEAPIYGRFGFGAATEACRWTLDARGARFRGDPVREGRVSLELAEDADLVDLAVPLHDRLAARSPGATPRDPRWWRLALGLEDDGSGTDPHLQRPAVVARDDVGRVVGVLRYRAVEREEARRPATTAEVLDLLADGPDATTALWRHLADLDLVVGASAPFRSPLEPLPHLLVDERAARQHERSDFHWVRVLDVPAALTARRYATAGACVLEVRDDAGLAGGRWRLEVGADGTADVEATAAEPDVVLPVAVLGSVVLGQVPLVGHVAAGDVDERTPGAARRLGALLHDPSAAVLGRTWF
ncbi:GNAT family N-acetyltransferase [Pseudokineococcus marinus]|uniref:GNAT family N-acetyltransferase n=1 Tax=Pseudokineococcus marinus TaxID=351215 RepID=A0A849BGZ9_9ACTN|nr:GNAT family N-acetyltransferase [Pseudokineococcus marinus]NNH22390.1 GNAT family N-acetyltransferase [Pseudokineococcus marinus]